MKFSENHFQCLKLQTKNILFICLFEIRHRYSFHFFTQLIFFLLLSSILYIHLNLQTRGLRHTCDIGVIQGSLLGSVINYNLRGFVIYSGWLLRPSPPDEEYPPPELFSHTITSGEEVRHTGTILFQISRRLCVCILFSMNSETVGQIARQFSWKISVSYGQVISYLVNGCLILRYQCQDRTFGCVQRSVAEPFDFGAAPRSRLL